MNQHKLLYILASLLIVFIAIILKVNLNPETQHKECKNPQKNNKNYNFSYIQTLWNYDYKNLHKFNS